MPRRALDTLIPGSGGNSLGATRAACPPLAPRRVHPPHRSARSAGPDNHARACVRGGAQPSCAAPAPACACAVTRRTRHGPCASPGPLLAPRVDPGWSMSCSWTTPLPPARHLPGDKPVADAPGAVASPHFGLAVPPRPPQARTRTAPGGSGLNSELTCGAADAPGGTRHHPSGGTGETQGRDGGDTGEAWGRPTAGTVAPSSAARCPRSGLATWGTGVPAAQMWRLLSSSVVPRGGALHLCACAARRARPACHGVAWA